MCRHRLFFWGDACFFKMMKIFAVGMNYAQHNKELDGALYKPERPVIFSKADSSLLKDHKPFFIPDWTSQVDYETGLAAGGPPERMALGDMQGL